MKFITIINSLYSVETDSEKIKLSQMASELLATGNIHIDNFLYTIFTKLSISNFLEDFHISVDEEFYEVKVLPYKDDDGKTRISIRMSYLQNYLNYHDDLDMRVLFFLFDELKKQNLELLVNDICVNTLQLRNGELMG